MFLISRPAVLITVAVGGFVAAEATPARATLVVQFDYTYDTNNFFPAASEQRAALEAAAQTFSDRFVDNLSAITPSGQNTWTPNFPHPGTGENQTLDNPSIPANSVRVFVGGCNLPGSTLSIGGPGGWNATGFQPWFDTIKARGQAGVLAEPPTDFARWGGAITFDTTPSAAWNFNLGSAVPGQHDFFSVALHELAHVLGIGTASSWDNLITSSNQFTGAHAASANGGTAPSTTADGGHWAAGTNSTIGSSAQEAAMTPSITNGTRKYFTALDFAGTVDLGWDLAIPGDANANNRIDIVDLGILATKFGQPSGRRWGLADFNYSGTVDLVDLGELATNFGYDAATSLAHDGGAPTMSFADALEMHPQLAAAIPEPSTLGVVAFGTASLLARRRQSNSSQAA